MSETTPVISKKLRGAEKLAKIPIKIEPTEHPLRKPDWIRVKLQSNDNVARVKNLLRDHHLVTVCEEASCPNLQECFGKGTATFMIMGDICTRRCSFCDVAHGRPNALDSQEPVHLAETVKIMGLKYVVITSVNRDDLRDGGAAHFAACIQEVRKQNPGIMVEILVPDFRGSRFEKAMLALADASPDVFNHNIETVPRLYQQVRIGADYAWSLQLLQEYKKRFPHIPTKSGLMLGLGETLDEIRQVLTDMRAHDIDMLTLGQYLQPSKHHMPIARYVTPEEFTQLGTWAKNLGFMQVASGPLVRSSYHADRQLRGEL